MDGHPCDGDDGSPLPCNESALCAGQQTLLPPIAAVPARSAFVGMVLLPL